MLNKNKKINKLKMKNKIKRTLIIIKMLIQKD